MDAAELVRAALAALDALPHDLRLVALWRVKPSEDGPSMVAHQLRALVPNPWPDAAVRELEAVAPDLIRRRNFGFRTTTTAPEAILAGCELLAVQLERFQTAPQDRKERNDLFLVADWLDSFLPEFAEELKNLKVRLDAVPWSRPRAPKRWRVIFADERGVPLGEDKFAAMRKDGRLRQSPDSTTRLVRLDLRDVRRFVPDFDDATA